MNAAQFGRYFLEFALLYPGAYLCLAPLREHLTAPRRTFGIAAGLVTVICAVCAGVCSVLEVPSNYFLLPILIVAFCCCGGGWLRGCRSPRRPSCSPLRR